MRNVEPNPEGESIQSWPSISRISDGNVIESWRPCGSEFCLRSSVSCLIIFLLWLPKLLPYSTVQYHCSISITTVQLGPTLVRIERVKMEESISSDTATQMAKCWIEETTILHEIKDSSFGLERWRGPVSEINRKEKTFSDLETSIVGK